MFSLIRRQSTYCNARLCVVVFVLHFLDSIHSSFLLPVMDVNKRAARISSRSIPARICFTIPNASNSEQSQISSKILHFAARVHLGYLQVVPATLQGLHIGLSPVH